MVRRRDGRWGPVDEEEEGVKVADEEVVMDEVVDGEMVLHDLEIGRATQALY